MKKIFALLCVFVLATACSDDDEVNDNGEQIVGTWMLEDWNIPPIENSEFEEEPTTCNKRSNITFNTDNTASSEFYQDENDGEDCVLETDTGEWEAHGDGEYTIQVPGFGEQTGTVNFESDNRFTFSLTGISMTFERE